MITIEAMKELRDKTEAGILDSKNALEESNNDIDKAIGILQIKGAKKTTNPLFIIFPIIFLALYIIVTYLK
ncbi:MAG: hypothetical protein PHN60_04225 [Candidatus Gracilibacteria bacterium]|nr:hypothetical protein [Candidatus Gracilibacteria bacterium]